MATPHNNPPAPHDRIGAQRGKCTARILRRLGLAVALAIVCAGLYLACIGLPRTVARHLVNHLRAHGFDVQAARIRLSWRGTLVAEKINVTSAGTWPRLSFSASSVELQPVCTALIRPRFVVRRLRVQDGTMHCLVRAGELPPKELSFHDLHLQTEFYGLDRWIIRTCRTEFAAIKLQLNGALTNVSALLGRERPAPEKTAAQLESSLWKLAALLEQLRLEGVTKVHLDFMADAAKPETFNGLVAIAVQGVETPWLKLSDATLSLRVNGLRDDSAGPAATLRARAARAECTWGTVSNASLEVNWTVYDPACTILSADLALSAPALGTKHFAAEQLELTAQCLHSLTNLLPDSGSARLCVAELSTKFGEAANAKASLQFRSVGAGAASAPPPRLMWLERFASLAVAAELELDQIASTNLPLNSLACELAWNAPSLVITNIAARFGTGEARSWLGLDTSTGRAEFGFDSNFDIRQLARLLPENTRQWLAKFDWASPPMLVGRGAAILPDWTSPQADWRTQFRAGLVASGRFELGTVSYRGITADAAAGSFCYSNSCWHVPDLRVSFPSGTVLVNIVSSDLTRELRCHLEGPITPEILRPVLGESAARQLDLLVLTQPAHIELDMTSARGEKLPHTARGRIAITNFTFRSERISEFCTELVYSNQLLRLLRPSAKRDEQFATAESIEIDIGTKQVRLYNASGRADPMVVARAIGPKTERAIAPYRFLTPPDVRVTGTVPFRGTRGTDLVFDINGGPFQWQRFNMARARSTVHWVDERVELIVAEAEFYGGKLGGKAQFDFSPPEGAQLAFSTAFTNVNLQLLARDISTRPTRLEGLLTGELCVTQANTFDWSSWTGYAHVRLRDGYVWELPMFSLLSPVLDAVVPGLGNSRFTEGRGRFIITNGLVHYPDLELRAPLLRMKLHGNVDFRQKLDARVEAELLRDTWLIGPVISTALSPLTKIFEYRLTGTLAEPKAQPVYVPKLLLVPLQPMRMLKGLIPSEQPPVGNNKKAQ